MTNEKNSEQTNESAPSRKGSSKKFLFLALALLLVAVAGAAGWHFFSPKAAADGQAPAPPLSIVHLNNFIVNLADTDRQAYLKVGIDLGVTKAIKKDDGSGHDLAETPEIRDAILSVLTTYHSADLLTSEGKARLKRNLIEALRKKVLGLGVRQIYFTDFLVQR